MPTSTSHSFPYVEPERHDGLSNGVSDVAAQTEASQERRTGGRGIQPGAKVIPTLGGKAHKGRTKLTHNVHLPCVSDTLKRRARYMRRRTCTELARNVGGGECGVIASALVKLASEDMALREAALESGNVDLARKLGESARMHLMYGREVCAKDAEHSVTSRPRESDVERLLRRQRERDAARPTITAPIEAPSKEKPT